MKRGFFIRNRIRGNMLLMLMLLCAGVSTRADAQCCLTDRLVINTGFDPLGAGVGGPGAGMAPGMADTTDPHWNICSMDSLFRVDVTNSGRVASAIGGDANIIGSAFGWKSFPGGSGGPGCWIGAFNGFNYSHTLTAMYNWSVCRTFTLHCDSRVTFHFDSMTADNWVTGGDVDGVPIVFPTTPLFGGNPGVMYSLAPFFRNLTAGVHTITIRLRNDNAGNNNVGVAMQANITTPSPSIVVENNPSCTAPTICSIPKDVCVGTTATLAPAVTGDTWTSDNAGIASVSTTGVITGVSAGTTMITHTVPAGLGCDAYYIVGVYNLHNPVTGSTPFCEGTTLTLASTTPGGTWSTSNPSVATVASTGIVTGVNGGTATITYTVGGCLRMATVTVIPTPDITGPLAVCKNSTLTLSSIIGGGTWVSANVSVATVGSSDGVVTPVNSGTAAITYTAGGCYATAVLTVQPTVNPIFGTARVCEGSTTILGGGAYGGIWTSANPGIATINGSAGIVTGINDGTVTVTYTFGACKNTETVTVEVTPTVTGSVLFCEGSTITLGSSDAGGTWASGNPAIAIVGSGTGVVSGVDNGTALITYTLGNCRKTAVVTVAPVPDAITGTETVCKGMTTTLSSPTTGGTWSSGNTSIATVGSGTGVVTGINDGTATITYTVGICYVTTVVTVEVMPSAITGSLLFCEGSTTTLSNTVSGGVWSSSNMGIANVGSSTGIVAGVNDGTAIITYTLGNCIAVTMVTVDTMPNIYGTGSVCEGGIIAIGGNPSGGTWSSSDPGTATVGSVSGIVTGVNDGTVTVTYTRGSCAATATVTVEVTPDAITGSVPFCVGTTITLSSATGGGVWTSGDASIATVGSSTGIVTGVNDGIALIIYTLGNCHTSLAVTVAPMPDVITGTMTICEGSTTTLDNTVSGGVWISSDAGIADVGSSTGIVTGESAGTATITYRLGICLVTTAVTVEVTPRAITGSVPFCEGTTITLSSTTAGGVWNSSNATIAAVGSSTGIVTGGNSGTATITYTLGNCYTTETVTVAPMPDVITGTMTLCEGSTTTLVNTVSGGVWISSDAGIADVGSSTGIVTGQSAGTATITYRLGICLVTTVVTVEETPHAITGSVPFCEETTITLSSTTAGGVWSSSNATIAAVGSSTGIVTGGSAGTATITYTLGNCYTTENVTVAPMPDVITGTMTLCEGSTTTLVNTVSGGVWISSDDMIAMVGSSTGIVTGMEAGTATITYRLGICLVTTVVTVEETPDAITGSVPFCEGTTINLSSTTISGVWTSSNTGIATVGSSTGVVSGVNDGTATITYTLGNCYAVTTVTVKPMPAVIGGGTSVCMLKSITLTQSVGGGTWSASGGASVSASGVVTGVSAGTAEITYSLSGCYVTHTVTVNLTPDIITGTTSVCVNSTITLSSSTTGGTWSTTSTRVTVGSSTGDVTGLTAGTANVTYTVPGSPSCPKVITLTVRPLPSLSMTGGTGCPGINIPPTIITSSLSGGTWMSSTPTVATVTSIVLLSQIANVTRYNTGTTVITNTSAYGCMASVTVSVHPVPAISGPTVVCQGGTVTLTGTPSTGGAWISINPGIATVGAGTGVVSGITPGTATIVYATTSLPGTCPNSVIVKVVPPPTFKQRNKGLCVGDATSVYVTEPGGTWSSSDTTIATVDSVDLNTADITGIAAGTVTISYTTSGGCLATFTLTVNPLPIITGPSSVCLGGTVTFTATPSGGYWGPPSSSYVTVNSSTGEVTGDAVGTEGIYYISPAGCAAKTKIDVENPPKVYIETEGGGLHELCLGTTLYAIYGHPAGGSWSSANPSIASTDPTTGAVTGVGVGSTTLTYSYTSPGGCSGYATFAMTIMPLASVSGPTTICMPMTTTVTMTGTPAGGTWSDAGSYTSAFINATTGVVSPYYPGMFYGRYSVTGYCEAYFNIYVDAMFGPHFVAPLHGFEILGPIGAHVNYAYGSTSLGTYNTGTATLSGYITYSGFHVPSFPGCCDNFSFVTMLNGYDTICTWTDSIIAHGLAGYKMAPGRGTISDQEQSVSLMPNPNNGQFTLTGMFDVTGTGMMEVEIVNMIGQTVHRQTAPVSDGRVHTQLNLGTDIPGGVYVVRMKNGGEIRPLQFTLIR